MTWTKLGDEFTAECGNVELSDAAFRTHVELIAWLYRVEQMDLHIPKSRLSKVLESDHADSAMRELLAQGWYRSHDKHYELLHHADVVRQSIAAQQKARATSKRTSQKYREKQAQESADGSAEVTRHVTPNADRQTDKQLGGDVIPCEHGVSWGCLKCKANERKGA